MPLPKREFRIAPSILSADLGRLAEEVKEAELAGADWIHVDVMDGRFVPNITIGPVVVEAVRKATKLPLDVHLMIDNPDRYAEAFADAGAGSIAVHAEAVVHLHRVVHLIKSFKVKAGVALNPATPVAALEQIAGDVDYVLVMTVNPGFGGQAFIPAMTEKIARIRTMIGARPIHLEVDGGVTPETAGACAKAGADVLVAGSATFKGGKYKENMDAIRAAAAKG